MTDLPPTQQQQLMEVVFAAEKVLRDHLQPIKINLASLGNVVPHVHWHIIPRFQDDSHFPHAIWHSAIRQGTDRPQPVAASLRIALEDLLQTP